MLTRDSPSIFAMIGGKPTADRTSPTEEGGCIGLASAAPSSPISGDGNHKFPATISTGSSLAQHLPRLLVAHLVGEDCAGQHHEFRKGAFGRHERHYRAGMRPLIAVSR
jgi:hypothetical protein